VTLATIKGDAKLKSHGAGARAALSVQSVTDVEWKLICRMGE
jgi:predicted RNA-binding protein with PUA-like domain